MFKRSEKEKPAKLSKADKRQQKYEDEYNRLIALDMSEEDARKYAEKATRSMWQKWNDHAEETAKIVSVELVGGHPTIKPGTVFLRPTNNQNEITINKQKLTVTGISWEEKGKRSAGKTAAGALIGAAIIPPAAIIGAAIGAKKKDDSVAIISFTHNGLDQAMYLRCKSKEYQRIVELIN